MQVYPPTIIVRTLLNEYFKYRRLTKVPRGMAPTAELRAFSDDDIISDMEQFHYVRVDAQREVPRGQRDWVVVLVLSADGKFSHHGPDLRRLIAGVEAERATADGRLDEIIVVATEEFFKKKNLTDVIREAQARHPHTDADAAGVEPFVSAHPYHLFSCNIPRNQSVPPHRIMPESEVEEYLARERLARRDLPVRPASDPPVVWLGGREGQVIEVLRPTQTAGEIPYVCRLEKGSL